MPLSKFQSTTLKLLAKNRSLESYLAGGAALHFAPSSKRYSNALDFFHDSEVRVATAYAEDSALLRHSGYELEIEINQPGYIRAIVSKGKSATKIEWAHDSAWRFMPPIFDPESGYRLHPVDLAINKVLALVGRDEARDFLDIVYCHKHVLSLGALVWAACGKDPSFTPQSLLELLKRRGRYRHEDFSRLHLVEAVNLQELRQEWLAALAQAEQFVTNRPPLELGCLYYSPSRAEFVTPQGDDVDIQLHYGRPGGVLPR